VQIEAFQALKKSRREENLRDNVSQSWLNVFLLIRLRYPEMQKPGGSATNARQLLKLCAAVKKMAK